MFLLSFSESVTLENAAFTWVVGDNDSKEVTVAGLNSIAAFESGANSTWNTVTSAIVENTLGHYGVGSKGSNGLYESTFTKLTGSAKYWLIGAYNTIFDDNAKSNFNSVQLKLSSIGVSMTQPTAEVSEPGALALMGLGLGLVLYRRKRRV
jgi:PEP-CTERM putative exosortase interaction domain